MAKNPPANAGDVGSIPWCFVLFSLDFAALIPGLGRSPGEENGNPLQYSCLDNPSGQRSLADYSPWGWEESDTTERLYFQHLYCELFESKNHEVFSEIFSIFAN